MKRTNVYNLKINRNTYDVLSADTEFYAFMRDRLYFTFDRLVDPKDIDSLNEKVRNSYKDRFLLRLVDMDESRILCLARIEETTKEEVVNVELLRVEDSIASINRLNREIDIKNAIIELYNDYCIEYDVEADYVKVYSVCKFEQSYMEGSFEEFGKFVKSKLSDENNGEAEQFLNALRAGTRSFCVSVTGDAIRESAEYASITFKCSAYYSGPQYVYAVGYIHVSNEIESNARREMERDSLTGVLSKAEITNLAINTIDVKKIKNVSIAIIDLDYFKKVNDTFGHRVGDEVLCQVASVIENEVSDTGVVGRIGGDEFFVIFYEAYDLETMRERLRSIKNIVGATFADENGTKPNITLSIGCAAYPKDADNYEDLFMLADFSLYRAKEKGRNRYIIYDVEKHGTLEEIKQRGRIVDKINNRGDMSPGDILCVLLDRVYNGPEYPIEQLLDDIVINFGIQRIMVYSGNPYTIAYMAGEKRLSKEVADDTQDYINDAAFWDSYSKENVCVINDITRLQQNMPAIYDKLVKQNVLSLIQIKFNDKNGKNAILSIEAVNKRQVWNDSLLHCYRLIAKMLSEYEF